MKDEMTRLYRSGDNLYSCHGHCRAFSRSFAKKFKWPAAFAEDSYSYLSCLKAGYKFRFANNAKIYYRLPQNFIDHFRQSSRFVHGIKQLQQYFPSSFVNYEHRLPLNVKFKVAVKYFFRNPLLFTSYVLTYLVVIIGAPFVRTEGVMWRPSESSKTLVKAK
jgi:hypothetical protein